MKVYRETHRKAFWATKTVFKTCCSLKRTSKRTVRLRVCLSERPSEREGLILPRLCLSEQELA